MRSGPNYFIPVNIRLFKSNYEYYNGIGKLSQTECINNSLHVSGTKKVNYEEYEDYIEYNKLDDIFKLHS